MARTSKAKTRQAEILREYGPYPGIDHVHGVTFDGAHVWFARGETIVALDPVGGGLVRELPVAAKIHQIDAGTGAILRTVESDRFVTGVSWVDGELWHGTMEDERSDLRRVDPETGEVLERLEMPAGVVVSGLEADGAGVFYCGGSTSGKVRAVRKP